MLSIQCNGKTMNDCLQCRQYFSLHSLHCEQGRADKTTTISCSIGGDKRFDENGNLVK